MENLNILKERIEEIVKVLEPIENVGVYTIDETEEKISFNTEGVYVDWAQCYFVSYEDALEMLRENKDSLEAALNGYLSIDNCPNVENNYDSYNDDCNAEEVQEAFEELKEIAEELENFSIYIKDVNFKEIIEYIENDERIKLNEELEEELEEKEEVKPVKRTKL